MCLCLYDGVLRIAVVPELHCATANHTLYRRARKSRDCSEGQVVMTHHTIRPHPQVASLQTFHLTFKHKSRLQPSKCSPHVHVLLHVIYLEYHITHNACEY